MVPFSLTQVGGSAVFTAMQDASTFLPYGGDVKVEDAFKIIEEYKSKVETVRATQVRSLSRARELSCSKADDSLVSVADRTRLTCSRL